MKRATTPSVMILFLLAVGLCSHAAAEPQTISIQGKLEKSNGSPLTGLRQYRVRFFNAASSGSQLGGDVTGAVAVVASGRFSIALTPPSQILNQNIVYYELAIDSGAGINGDGNIDAADVFPQRIQVHSVPFSRNSGQLGGTAASSYVKTADLTDNSTTTLGGSQFWRLGGNTLTSGTTQYIGTNNSQPFEIRVGGKRTLLMTSESQNTAGNIIFGHPLNTVSAGVIAGTISGGGALAQPNTVTGLTGTIGGGVANTADKRATVGGGLGNQATGDGATVGGGFLNKAGGLNSTVAGGERNLTTGTSSMVAGGAHNAAIGDFSFAAGRRAQALHPGAFVWGDATDTPFVSTSDNQFIVRATGGVGINKNNPTTGSLDISGDLIFDGTIKGKTIRTEPSNGLRLLRGVVQGSDASIFVGEGFTVTHIGPGFYLISFNTAYSDSPAESVTPLGTDLYAVLQSSNSGAFIVKFLNTAGIATDPAYFHFIVVG